MYHYATVSKALDELNENGFTYDFNFTKQKFQQINEIKHIYRYEGDTDPGMRQSFMVHNPLQVKGAFVTGLIQFMKLLKALVR
jgi:hypothetical protein